MKKLIVPYVFIAFFAWIYMCLFGNYSYESKSYNLGRALAWPASLIREDPEINGSSTNAFYSSLEKLLQAHDRYQGQVYAIQAIGQIILLKYVEENKYLTKNDIDSLIYEHPSSLSNLNSIIQKLYTKNGEYNPSAINKYLCEKLDGDDYHDLISDGKSALKDLKNIAEERR